jgi:6-phosphogluconate dehydrogenase
MTKKELAQAIKNHDHHFQYSDDHRVWTAGRARRDEILNELAKQFDKKSQRLMFWNEYAPENCGYTKSYIQELINNGN